MTTYESSMDDVLTLNFLNNAAITGGTFTLSLNGSTTAAIAWSSTPATLVSNIQTALNGLPAAITGPYQPVVNGTSLSAISITFQTLAANANGAATPTVSFNGSGLTLGGAGVATVAASPTGAIEATNTVTITTTAAHGFLAGQYVTITGVGVAGYNGTYLINSVPTTTSFTYIDSDGHRPAGLGRRSLAAVVSSVSPSLGSGTLNLQGVGYYTGTTTANQGTLSLSAGGQLAAPQTQSNNSQTLTFGGTVTGGTFTLTFNGQTTAAITYANTTATTTAAGVTESNNLVTVTTTAAHGFLAGQTVTITGVTPASYNGTYVIVSVPTTTTFTYINPTSGLTRFHGEPGQSPWGMSRRPTSSPPCKRCPMSATTSRCPPRVTRSSPSRAPWPASLCR